MTTPTNPADYAAEVVRRVQEAAAQYRKDLREQLKGVPIRHHEIRGDDFVAWFNLSASQRRGIMVEVDPMTGQQKETQIDLKTGKPVDVPLGPNWVAALSHPNLHGGREVLAQMRRNSRRALNG